MSDKSYRPQYDNSHALVIGINGYLNINQLDIARADAESVAAVLVGNLGFPKSHVSVLLDDQATRAKIMERFLAFESLGPDDRLFVFFAGHGATVTGRRGPVGYLVPVDGKLDDKSTLIRWDDLTRNAEIIPAKHILFVMDACYSGLAIQRTANIGEQRFVSDMLQRLSRQVITAGKADETVADSGGPTGKNSIFTSYLLEGLQGKAVNENGVLTASYLMNYVYQSVANDPKSNQTPHFGHFDGDGDFILRTPSNEHLPKGPAGDYLVKPIAEQPEPQLHVSAPSIKPVFAEKNGYADPDSDSFGRNEWTRKLGRFVGGSEETEKVERPFGWLALVVEPVSNQPVNLDIANLAKALPEVKIRDEKLYEHFSMPNHTITTAKSVIFLEPDYPNSDRMRSSGEECWKRFLRIERSGAIEYCDYLTVTAVRGQRGGTPGIRVFRYVSLIGQIWTFLYAAKRILSLGNYEAGVRYLVSIVGAKDSILEQFARQPREDGHSWRQPFDSEIDGRFDSPLKWKCRDPNIQMPFKLVLSSLGEPEAKKLVMECAEQLGLAYNHQSEPRCFNLGTDVFPWEQFHSGH